jgi:hypothetical protein
MSRSAKVSSDEARVQALLSAELSRGGEEVINVWRPSPAALEHEAEQAAPMLCGCLRGKGDARWAGVVHAAELYVLTSQSVYTVVDKVSLDNEALALGCPHKAKAVPKYARIAFTDITGVREAGSASAPLVEVQGRRSWLGDKECADETVTLRWLGLDATVLAMVNSAHEDCMNSHMLAMLPKGMLENRIAHAS